MTPHDTLMALTAAMPMKQIDIDGKPYLQRYFAGTFANDHDLWLHRFLSCDGERHLHCHPFEARTIILTGGYTEETPEGMFERYAEPAGLGLIERRLQRGLSMWPAPLEWGRPITVFDWHRIASVRPDTWTAFIVGPQRLPAWYFRDDDGDLDVRLASPRDWWKNHGPR